MFVAICEDNNECINQIEAYIKRLDFENIGCKSFNSAEAFLDEYEKDTRAFDILITDIEMDKMDGVELANKIRASNRKIIIFFITSYTEYAIRCFEPEPMNFWLKPVEYKVFEHDMRRAEARIKRSKRHITIVENRNNIRIDVADIVYLETKDRKTIIHLSDGNVHITNKLISHIYNELPEDLFAINHQSFIVNMAFIKVIKDRDIILNVVDIHLPVGRTCKKNLRKQFLEFNERESFG